MKNTQLKNHVKKSATKLEGFLELLLKSGNKGVKRFTVMGKLKTSNPGSSASAMRKEGINISRGKAYTILDLQSFTLVTKRLNDLRKARGEEIIVQSTLLYWLELFNFDCEV